MSLSLFIIMYPTLVNNCPPNVQDGEQCGLTPAVQEAAMLTSDYVYQPGSVPPPSGQLPLPTSISAPTARSVTVQINVLWNLNKVQI